MEKSGSFNFRRQIGVQTLYKAMSFSISEGRLSDDIEKILNVFMDGWVLVTTPEIQQNDNLVFETKNAESNFEYYTQ